MAIRYCHSLECGTLFSKVDSNKLRCNVKYEITFICTKFGGDLLNTSKVASRNKVASLYWPISCITF